LYKIYFFNEGAIALPQLPNSELLAAALRYRTPSNFPTSFFNEPRRREEHEERRESDRIPSTSPNSELLAAALRYRTPSTSQHPFLTNHSRHREHRERREERAIAPPQPPTSLFKRTAETQRTQRVSRKVAKDSTFPPISFFNKPRRREEHEGRGEERANFTFSSQVSLFAIKYVILLGNFLNVTKL
jgi:hypothetical protein